MIRFSPVLVFCFLLISYTTQAQVPNAGFEDWTLTEPDGWTTLNVPALSLYTVTKSTDAHTGSFSLRGTVVPIPPTTIAMSAVIQSGPGGHGTAVSVRYAAVSGYYKCSLLSGDKLALNFAMFQGGTGIAVGAQVIPTSTSTWTPFSVPFTYFGAGAPDNCTLQISIVGPVTGGDFHVGSWYQVDDLVLSGVSAVSPETKPSAYSLDQNFPNPFNPATTIRYSLAHRSQVTLAVFNIVGERVATLVNEMQESGTHDARFDASGLASGTYFYRLMAGAYVETRQLVVMK